MEDRSHCQQRFHLAERPPHPRQPVVFPHLGLVGQPLRLWTRADFAGAVQPLFGPDRVFSPARAELFCLLVKEPVEVLAHAPIELVLARPQVVAAGSAPQENAKYSS